jgi:hypothetical protein
MRCWLLPGGLSLESMTVLGVMPLALRGSAHVLMVLTSASSESGHGAQGISGRDRARDRGRKDALQSQQGVGCTDTSRRDKKTQRGLTGQEGGDIIAVLVQGELGEGNFEVGELTDGREHFCGGRKRVSARMRPQTQHAVQRSLHSTITRLRLAYPLRCRGY